MISLISLPLDSIISMKLKMQELLMEPVDVNVVIAPAEEIRLVFEAKDKIVQFVFSVENISYPTPEFNVRFNWGVFEGISSKYGKEFETICSCEELEDWSKESSFYDRIFEPIKNYINNKQS